MCIATYLLHLLLQIVDVVPHSHTYFHDRIQLVHSLGLSHSTYCQKLIPAIVHIKLFALLRVHSVYSASAIVTSSVRQKGAVEQQCFIPCGIPSPNKAVIKDNRSPRTAKKYLFSNEI